jgi:activator of HSP90 ATPase
MPREEIKLYYLLCTARNGTKNHMVSQIAGHLNEIFTQSEQELYLRRVDDDISIRENVIGGASRGRKRQARAGINRDTSISINSALSGSMITGSTSTGNMITGSMSTGNMITGSMSTGNMITGSMSTGNMITGNSKKVYII